MNAVEDIFPCGSMNYQQVKQAIRTVGLTAGIKMLAGDKSVLRDKDTMMRFFEALMRFSEGRDFLI